MRIAIVAPSPNPFVMGGAENLYWGLVDYLNRETDHAADLIKLPVKETSLPDLVAGYEAFSRLDLSGFDAVISTKYPAWMVRHPNHIVDMLHTCRGYYDWYPPEAGGVEYRGGDAAIVDLLRFLERRRGQRDALPEFFEHFHALAGANHPEIRRHPGPVGRAIIHFLDGVGLAPTAIRRYAAIADTVRRRRDYFPNGVAVKVVHHPTNKVGFRDAGDEYFFTVSRFYSSKRIDLLIAAYRLTDIPVHFKIAGTGNEEAKLRELAAGDARIEFVGFVADPELVEHYAHAIAVPFVPADEDYGYIALEAMLSAKPVITTTDSGGPLELVRDGETGVVVEPRPEALADAFRRLHADREWARELGRRGRERAAEVSWKNAVALLLGEHDDASAKPRRKPGPPRPRVTVLNAYSVHPPTNGGQNRLHSLYKALARHVDVDLVTLALREQGDDVIHAADGLRELRVGRSEAHEKADLAAHAKIGVPVYDITALENVALTPAYLTVLENSLAGSKAVVVSHPYMLAALRKTGYAGRFLHESHNVESTLKAQMLPECAERPALVEMIKRAEGDCCREAALTYATCEDDAQALLRMYGGRPEEMIVIPNGTDPRTIRFTGAEERSRLRRRLRLDARPIALFLASGHRPNLEAAEHLFKLAHNMPDVDFALVGNLADAFTHRLLPDNVWRIGTVSEESRNVWLEAAGVALNPVLYGGGTNLKLLDYFAAGTPVVSTEVGIRGTQVEANSHALVAGIDEFEGAIRTILAGGPRIERMTREARSLVETRFDWEGLADRLYAEMRARQLV